MSTTALTRVQKRSFSATCDIYLLDKNSVDVNKRVIETITRIAVDVPCRVMARNKIASFIAGLGLSNEQSMSNTDVLRLPEKILNTLGEPFAPGMGYLFHVKSGMGLNTDKWMAFMAEGAAQTFQSDTRVYLVRGTLKPRGEVQELL